MGNNLKDTFFFSHDFGARNDPKILSLMASSGVAGVGIFWCIIEQIYEQGGSLPLTSVASIAYALRVEKDVVEDVIINHGLFQNDGEIFWSESVNARLDKRRDIAKKRKAAANKRWGNAANNASASKKETRAPIKTEAPKPSDADKIDYKAIVQMYHKECPSFAKVIKISDARKQKMRIRLEEMQFDMDMMKKVFQTMEKSKFLRGDNKNGWKATFDWVFENPKNWVKIAEGNYSDKSVAGSTNNVNDIWG